MLNYLKKINIICGHYGVGKTNFCLNLAIDLARKGEPVTLVDLDIVNPYFRSGDYHEKLEKYGVKVIAPNFVHSNVDVPSIPAEVSSIFAEQNRTVIIDLGGDEAGTVVLGRFLDELKKSDYALFYICNFNRGLTTTPEAAAEIFNEISSFLKLTPTALINNTHLGQYTDIEIISAGQKKAQELSKLLKLPVAATTCPDWLYEKAAGKISESKENIFKTEIFVKAFD